MKILIIEDNKDLLNALVKGFTNKGFRVDSAEEGKDGYNKLYVNEYDVAIIDLNLPFKSGFEIVKEAREANIDIPFLALTARDQLEDKLIGFKTGFDDYITKPFEFPELIARVEALIRRSKPNSEVILSIGDLRVDPQKRIVLYLDEEIELTKIEFNILEYLLRKKGIVVSNSELIEHIWSEESDLLDPPIRSHIKNLRKKIHDVNFDILKTLPGIGYKID